MPVRDNDVLQKHVMLAGLDDKLAGELSDFLRARGYAVQRKTRLEAVESDNDSGGCALMFCDIRLPELNRLLPEMKMPVVVVSRLPEVNDWLDAMDAGAADYCAAPFEREQLDWILESNLGRAPMAAAA